MNTGDKYWIKAQYSLKHFKIMQVEAKHKKERDFTGVDMKKPQNIFLLKKKYPFNTKVELLRFEKDKRWQK